MKFEQPTNYLFIFCHPDDEVYTVNIIKTLTDAGKRVDFVYVTSGDYAGPDFGPKRELEATKSAEALGVHQSHVYFLRFPERELLSRANEAREAVHEIVQSLSPECIVSHDYEGGHNLHDFVSYCTYTASKKTGADLWVFPAYHGQPASRLWNQFIPGRKADFTLEVDQASQLKRRVIEAHATQKDFFDLILHSTSKEPFLSREVLRFMESVDFTKRPTDPLGYEFAGSPVKFSDFAAAVKSSGA